MLGSTVTKAISFDGCRILRAFFFCFAYMGLDVVHPAWSADNYPDKNIRMVVPFPGGGGVDLTARIISEGLHESLGQSIVVDNRPGGSAIVGTEIVAHARPDGYTLLTISNSHTSLKSLHAKLSFDPIADFAPIVETSFTPNVVVVSTAATDITSIGDLIRKARTGVLTYASVGVGTTPHLATELFKMVANVNIEHVPFSGSNLGSEMIALINGDVTMFITSLSAVMPFIQSGKLKVLAVTSAARISLMPQIPTVAESGVPSYEFTIWYGVLAPAGTPPDIVSRLNIEINKMLKASGTRQKLLTTGNEPVGGTSAEFGALLKTEAERWAKVINFAHIQPE